MSWFYQKSIVRSSHNGEIVLVRLLGQWEVRAGTRQQSGPAMEYVWRNALARTLPHLARKKSARVLILGFGGGGIAKRLYKLLPGCSITAIEYDPAMTEIADKLAWWRPYHRPLILTGDAKDLLPQLGVFDLVLIDLFHDNKPSALLQDEDFLLSLRDRLDRQGIAVVNACSEPEYLLPLARLLPRTQRWQTGINHLGSFEFV